MWTTGLSYVANTSFLNWIKSKWDRYLSIFHFSLSAAPELVNRHSANDHQADNDQLHEVIRTLHGEAHC